MRPDGVPASRLTWRAWASEVVRGVGSRPLRVALTIAGTVLGTATLVAVLDLTASAQGQVSERFSLLRATQVDVQPRPGATLPADAAARVGRIDGVTAAGTAREVTAVGWESVTALPPGTPGARPATGTTVLAVGPGFLEASLARTGPGRSFDALCFRQPCQTVMLGAVAAQRLGVSPLRDGQVVHVDGAAFTVQGIIDDTARNTPLLGAVVVPEATATAMWGPAGRSTTWMTVDTRVGAATVVGQQLPLALSPADPAAVELKDAGYVDAYRTVFPDPVTHPGMTWPADNPATGVDQLAWAPKADERDRIDYVFASPTPGFKLLDAGIVGPAGSIIRGERKPDATDDVIASPTPWASDHKAVLATYRLAGPKAKR